jgi:hypothetical protein
VGPFEQKGENKCTPVATLREIVARSDAVDRFADARPGSLVCFRTHQGAWRTTRADANGQVEVNFERRATTGDDGYRLVLYRGRTGEWVQRVLQPDATALPPNVSLTAAWITGQTLPRIVAVSALVLVLLVVAAGLAWRIVEILAGLVAAGTSAAWRTAKRVIA